MGVRCGRKNEFTRQNNVIWESFSQIFNLSYGGPCLRAAPRKFILSSIANHKGKHEGI